MASTTAAVTATAHAHAHAPAHTAVLPPAPHDNGTSLIARAEALNAFMKLQPAADQARHQAASSPNAPASSAGVTPLADSRHPFVSPASTPRGQPHTQGRSLSHGYAASPPTHSTGREPKGCFCFGGGNSTASPAGLSATSPHGNANATDGRPRREYYPDNLSVQPKPHPWENGMEWLIVASIDFLERSGLHERNLFAVSAVDDLVRAMNVPLGTALPLSTDPHVAAGVIKAKIRHAETPLVAKTCLRDYIDSQGGNLGGNNTRSTDENGEQQQQQKGKDKQLKKSEVPNQRPATFRTSILAKTVNDMLTLHSARRAYILARFMRLLGRVSANIEHSRMNAHCLAKCVAPSMLHWDPNSGFALLMLGKITAYVMAMIEDARVFDEQLCLRIEELEQDGGW